MASRQYWRGLAIAGVVLVSASLVSAEPATSGSPDDSGDEAQIDTPERARAIKTRRTFGLATDEQTVSAAERRFVGERGGPRHLGIPLTEAEEADIKHRTDLQRVMDPLVAAINAEDQETGGIWINQLDHGRIVINLVASAEERKFRRLVDKEYEFPDYVDFVRVAQSLADLTGLQDRVTNDIPHLREDGIDVTSVSLLLAENEIEIGVYNLTAAETEELKRRYPTARPMEFGHAKPADNRHNSGGQWKAGMKLAMVGTGGTCTANFTWVSNANSNVRYIGTAGHCNGAANFRGTGTRAFHNANLGAANPSIVANTLITNPSNADAAMLAWPSGNTSLASNIVIREASNDRGGSSDDFYNSGASVTRGVARHVR